jgi:hypothetical protein
VLAVGTPGFARKPASGVSLGGERAFARRGSSIDFEGQTIVLTLALSSFSPSFGQLVVADSLLSLFSFSP